MKGSLTDVVCAWVGGANTTPYLNSAMHFAKQKTYDYFLLLQNMNSVGENKKVQKPARIPPQTPPAGGTEAEAGRIYIPSQIVSPCRVRISSFYRFRFRFLDLCIRFGKIISKVCEGFNSGARKLDTNSFFEDESVRSPSPANGRAWIRSAMAPPSLWREMKRILMLSGE